MARKAAARRSIGSRPGQARSDVATTERWQCDRVGRAPFERAPQRPACYPRCTICEIANTVGDPEITGSTARRAHHLLELLLLLFGHALEAAGLHLHLGPGLGVAAAVELVAPLSPLLEGDPAVGEIRLDISP